MASVYETDSSKIADAVGSKRDYLWDANLIRTQFIVMMESFSTRISSTALTDFVLNFIPEYAASPPKSVLQVIVANR